jgi:hypothetical protein
MRRILIKICLLLVVISLIFRITSAVESYLTAHFDKLLKTQATKISSVVDISWRDIQIRLFHLDVILHHVKIKASSGPPLGIEQILLSNMIKFPLKLNDATIHMKGIHFFEIQGQTTNKTNKTSHFDLHKMKASMHLEVFYDPSRHNLYINKLKFMDKNWGLLQLKLVLNHFHPREIRMFQFESLLIKTIDLQYQDYALLKQLMVSNPEKQSEFNHFMAEAVTLAIETAKKLNNPAQVKSLGVLQNFFLNPGQLTLKINLRQPVSISQIINSHRVSELLEMINYSVTNA